MGKGTRERQRHRVANLIDFIYTFHQVVIWEKGEKAGEDYVKDIEYSIYQTTNNFADDKADITKEESLNQKWREYVEKSRDVNNGIYINDKKIFNKASKKLSKILKHLNNNSKEVIGKLWEEKQKEEKEKKKQKKNKKKEGDSKRSSGIFTKISEITGLGKHKEKEDKKAKKKQKKGEKVEEDIIQFEGEAKFIEGSESLLSQEGIIAILPGKKKSDEGDINETFELDRTGEYGDRTLNQLEMLNESIQDNESPEKTKALLKLQRKESYDEDGFLKESIIQMTPVSDVDAILGLYDLRGKNEEKEEKEESGFLVLEEKVEDEEEVAKVEEIKAEGEEKKIEEKKEEKIFEKVEEKKVIVENREEIKYEKKNELKVKSSENGGKENNESKEENEEPEDKNHLENPIEKVEEEKQEAEDNNKNQNKASLVKEIKSEEKEEDLEKIDKLQEKLHDLSADSQILHEDEFEEKSSQTEEEEEHEKNKIQEENLQAKLLSDGSSTHINESLIPIHEAHSQDEDEKTEEILEKSHDTIVKIIIIKLKFKIRTQINSLLTI